MGEAEKVSGDRILRVGVVGVGVMGSNHARVLSELPGVKLVGVADPDRKRCDHVARLLGCASFAEST
jgi:UDP-N-acetylglucosamine 3-dehydrogenase